MHMLVCVPLIVHHSRDRHNNTLMFQDRHTHCCCYTSSVMSTMALPLVCASWKAATAFIAPVLFLGLSWFVDGMCPRACRSRKFVTTRPAGTGRQISPHASTPHHTNIQNAERVRTEAGDDLAEDLHDVALVVLLVPDQHHRELLRLLLLCLELLLLLGV